MFYTSSHAYFQTQPHSCIGRHQAMEMRSFLAGFIPQMVIQRGICIMGS